MTPDEHVELTADQIDKALAGEWCPPRVPDDRIGRDGYIWIPKWRQFQHYRRRRPAWIKSYVGVLSDDDYLELAISYRGVLHGLWLMVAEVGQGRCRARADHVQNQLVLAPGLAQKSLVSLNHAGFIRIIASKLPVAESPRARPETETETEGGPNPPSGSSPTPKTTRARAPGSAAHDTLANGQESELTRRLRTLLATNRTSVIAGIQAGHYDRHSLAFLDDHAWHTLEQEAHDPDDQEL